MEIRQRRTRSFCDCIKGRKRAQLPSLVRYKSTLSEAHDNINDETQIGKKKGKI